MTQPALKTKSPLTAHPWISTVIALLVAADIWFTLYVPLYASATPKVGDFPFFYFYLMIYMPVTGVVLWIVYLLQKKIRIADSPAAGRGTGTGTSEVTR
ncbi:MAG TPA: DUF3311 domain-containing protein [Streptosporangiaceae bacterium]|nr:DUF3311 domain-containing protein [Streptosporangiaceae bacterium]